MLKRIPLITYSFDKERNICLTKFYNIIFMISTICDFLQYETEVSQARDAYVQYFFNGTDDKVHGTTFF